MFQILGTTPKVTRSAESDRRQHSNQNIKMETPTEDVKPIESTDLLCSSIPARMPNGKCNPEYRRWYRAKRKAAGNPIQANRDGEARKRYRATEKGKAQVKRWNESEKAKAASEKYRASPKGKRKRHETGEQYASRILREMEKSDAQ